MESNFDPQQQEICKIAILYGLDTSKPWGLEPSKKKPRRIKLERIPVDPEELEQLQQLLTSDNKKISVQVKYEAMKRLVGGRCFCCSGIPTQMLSYHAYGAKVIQRYCDSCISRGEHVK